MARLIPNEATKAYFVATALAAFDPSAVAATALTGGVDLTGELVTLDASARGNTVPTPDFESLFETSVPGTSSATFTAEFYRDSDADDAWTALPRNTEGYFGILRFGGSGADGAAATGDEAEIWPVRVTTRAALPLTNNEVQRFSIECSVPIEPDEAVTLT